VGKNRPEQIGEAKRGGGKKVGSNDGKRRRSRGMGGVSSGYGPAGFERATVKGCGSTRAKRGQWKREGKSLTTGQGKRDLKRRGQGTNSRGCQPGKRNFSKEGEVEREEQKRPGRLILGTRLNIQEGEMVTVTNESGTGGQNAEGQMLETDHEGDWFKYHTSSSFPLKRLSFRAKGRRRELYKR